MSDVTMKKKVFFDEDQQERFAKAYGEAVKNGETVEEFNARMKREDIVPEHYSDNDMKGRCNNHVTKARKLGYRIPSLQLGNKASTRKHNDESLKKILETYGQELGQ